MTTLRTAAQQALEAMSSFESGTNGLYEGEFAQEIAALKAALVEDALQRFTDVNQELEAALAEPVQEPAELPLEEALSKAYYYTEDGKWRGPDVRDWDRWHAVAKVAVALTRRAALAEPKQDVKGCDHCNHPLYAAIKCKVCGRLTEPVQEPYAWMSVGGSIWRHKTTEDDVPLYTAPRKPLAEWQINDLMSDIDPEDRDSWSFRQGVYAAEKHHGVRR